MEERARVLKVIQEQYLDCQVVDLERAIVLIPPEDGRYGMLALEVPMHVPSLICHDERMLSREVMTRMNGLVRALPDVGRQTLDALSLSNRTRNTIWAGAHLETFLRFGIMTEADRKVKQLYSRQEVLKIVPPQYATDVQVIIRTRANEQLETLVDLMQENEDYQTSGWTCSYGRVMGFNHVFGVVKISRDLVAIRDQMEEYWQLVNGPWSDGALKRQYVNRWMSGMDFR